MEKLTPSKGTSRFRQFPNPSEICCPSRFSQHGLSGKFVLNFFLNVDSRRINCASQGWGSRLPHNSKPKPKSEVRPSYSLQW